MKSVQLTLLLSGLVLGSLFSNFAHARDAFCIPEKSVGYPVVYLYSGEADKSTLNRDLRRVVGYFNPPGKHGRIKWLSGVTKLQLWEKSISAGMLFAAYNTALRAEILEVTDKSIKVSFKGEFGNLMATGNNFISYRDQPPYGQEYKYVVTYPAVRILNCNEGFPLKP